MEKEGYKVVQLLSSKIGAFGLGVEEWHGSIREFIELAKGLLRHIRDKRLAGRDID